MQRVTKTSHFCDIKSRNLDVAAGVSPVFDCFVAADTAASTTRWSIHIHHKRLLTRHSFSEGGYDAALLLLFAGEFVCWHAFLASRRIDCWAADFAVGAGLKCDSKGKLGGEEIPLTFRTDPEFRKTPVGGRFDRQEILTFPINVPTKRLLIAGLDRPAIAQRDIHCRRQR